MFKGKAFEETWSPYLQHSARWHSLPKNSSRKPTPQPAATNLKIDNRWKSTSTKSYIKHLLFYLQLRKTTRDSVIVTPRVSSFLKLESDCQRLSERRFWIQLTTNTQEERCTRGNVANIWLNDWTSANTVKISTRNRDSSISQPITSHLNLHFTAFGWCTGT